MGAKVEARYKGNPNSEEWYPGTITAIDRTNGTASIEDEDGDKWSGAPPATIRARR